jgi:hypothetical protein
VFPEHRPFRQRSCSLAREARTYVGKLAVFEDEEVVMGGQRLQLGDEVVVEIRHDVNVRLPRPAASGSFQSHTADADLDQADVGPNQVHHFEQIRFFCQVDRNAEVRLLRDHRLEQQPRHLVRVRLRPLLVRFHGGPCAGSSGRVGPRHLNANRNLSKFPERRATLGQLSGRIHTGHTARSDNSAMAFIAPNFWRPCRELSNP